MGGFYMFSTNAAARELEAVEALDKAVKNDDKLGGHRAFVKRDSIVQFMNLDPARHTPENAAAAYEAGLKTKADEEAAAAAAKAAAKAAKAGAEEPVKRGGIFGRIFG